MQERAEQFKRHAQSHTSLGSRHRNIERNQRADELDRRKFSRLDEKF